jgi:hypothetical protein
MADGGGGEVIHYQAVEEGLRVLQLYAVDLPGGGIAASRSFPVSLFSSWLSSLMVATESMAVLCRSFPRRRRTGRWHLGTSSKCAKPFKLTAGDGDSLISVL